MNYYEQNETYYSNTISKYNQYDLKDIVQTLKQKNILDDLYALTTDINKKYIYKSDMHGIKHNYRVIFYAFVICYLNNITGDNYKIIMDACKYHDVGRINDEKDDMHGLRSSNIIPQILNNDLFYNDDNLSYLKAIVELHSIDDSNNEKIFKKYHLHDYNRFKLLYSVLKDADGLDRVRLYYKYPNIKWLNPSMLRLDSSKKLIKCAHELNDVRIGDL